MFVRGLFGKWTLYYSAYQGTDATLSPVYYAAWDTNDGTTKEFSVIQLTGAAASDLASVYDATPTTPETVTSASDVWEEITWTPGADEVLELDFRKSDANNRFILRCDQAGGTIKLIQRLASTETEIQSAAQTWTVDTPYRVAVRAIRRYCVAWVNSTGKINQAGLSNLINNTGCGASGFAAATNYAVYPIHPTLPAPYDLSGFHWFVAIGDSKTDTLGWQATLLDLLETATGNRWAYDYSAISGQTTGGQASTITTDLARISNTPDYVLINLGSNDMGSAQVEATWKGYLRTILDAVHTKWSGAKIYLMRPWRRTYTTTPDTIAGWINDVILEAAYSGYCFDGPDERVFIENGDDGATYTSDGLHPNAAGYALTGAQWAAALP
jgi:lysophospholipase L1-like esterase